MADPITMITVGTAVLGAVTTVAGGAQAEAQGKAQQQQAEIRANEELAAGQRASSEEERKKLLAQSALASRAAASGSGVSDPTIGKLFQGIEEEGSYNSKATLATGQNRANSARYEGALARWQGKNASRNSKFEAAGTIMGSFLRTPMAKRYGDRASTSGRTGYGR
jgi:hypothetical protein